MLTSRTKTKRKKKPREKYYILLQPVLKKHSHNSKKYSILYHKQKVQTLSEKNPHSYGTNICLITTYAKIWHQPTKKRNATDTSQIGCHVPGERLRPERSLGLWRARKGRASRLCLPMRSLKSWGSSGEPWVFSMFFCVKNIFGRGSMGNNEDESTIIYRKTYMVTMMFADAFKDIAKFHTHESTFDEHSMFLCMVPCYL